MASIGEFVLLPGWQIIQADGGGMRIMTGEKDQHSFTE